MTHEEIIRMAREAGWRESFTPPVALVRFFHAAHAAGEQAERDRTKRLVEDMQAELRQRRMTGGNT